MLTSKTIHNKGDMVNAGRTCNPHRHIHTHTARLMFTERLGKLQILRRSASASDRSHRAKLGSNPPSPLRELQSAQMGMVDLNTQNPSCINDSYNRGSKQSNRLHTQV